MLDFLDKPNNWPYVQNQPLKFFYKKDVRKNFAKFTGKQLCQSLLLYKVVGLRRVC